MMFATTTKAAASTTKPMMTGRLSVSMAWTETWPRPLRPKTVSTTMTPAEKLADVDAELGDDRGQGGPDAVAEDDPAFGQALGPGHPHVVLTEDVQQLAA